jgi:hypothetical protein
LYCVGSGSIGTRAVTCWRDSQFTYSVFERAFENLGLLRAIRTDNGAPLTSGNALGIRIERQLPRLCLRLL